MGFGCRFLGSRSFSRAGARWALDIIDNTHKLENEPGDTQGNRCGNKNRLKDTFALEPPLSKLRAVSCADTCHAGFCHCGIDAAVLLVAFLLRFIRHNYI